MKRILSVVLALLMVLTLTACGQSDKDTKPSEQGSAITSGVAKPGDLPPEPPKDVPPVDDTPRAPAEGPGAPPDDGTGGGSVFGPAIPIRHDSEWLNAEDYQGDLPGEKDYLEKDSVRLSMLFGIDITDKGFSAQPVTMPGGAGLKLVDAYIRATESTSSYLVPTGDTNLLDKYIMTVDSIDNELVDGVTRRSSYTFQYYVDKDGNVVDNREDAYIIYQGNVIVSVEQAQGFEDYCFFTYAAMQQACEYATILPISTFRTFSALNGAENGVLAEIKTEKWTSYSRQANMSRYVQDGGILQVYFFSQASTDKGASFDEVIAGGEKVLSKMEDDIFTAYGLYDILKITRANPNPLVLQ